MLPNSEQFNAKKMFKAFIALTALFKNDQYIFMLRSWKGLLLDRPVCMIGPSLFNSNFLKIFTYYCSEAIHINKSIMTV